MFGRNAKTIIEKWTLSWRVITYHTMANYITVIRLGYFLNQIKIVGGCLAIAANFVIYRKGEVIYLSDTDPFVNIIKKQQEIFTIEKL